MRLTAHNKFGNPVDTAFTELVIRDDFGNIVGVVVQYEPNNYEIAHVKDRDFHKLVDVLGLASHVPEIRVIDARSP